MEHSKNRTIDRLQTTFSRSTFAGERDNWWYNGTANTRRRGLKYEKSNINRYLVYTILYRGVSTSSRSEVTLVGNSISRELTVCEVPQLEFCKSPKAILAGLQLFKLYEKRINAASKKIKNNFTLFKIVEAFLIYERLHNLIVLNKDQKGKLKIPLYQNLSNSCVLLIAYSSLRKKSGEIDGIPVENVTLGGILSLSIELKTKQYQPNPVKSLYIPKSCGKFKPLGIASTKDKIVQQVLIIVLQPRFEQVFLDVSHGFRPNKSCHTALKDIYLRWCGVKWFVECDFVQCFDRRGHAILLDTFNKYVDDYWTSNLIHKILKVEYIHFGGLVDSDLSAKIGVPQGSIISSLFCNILLHDFDKGMTEYCKRVFNFVSVSRKTKTFEEYCVVCYNFINPNWKKMDACFKKVSKDKIYGEERRKSLFTIRKKVTASFGIKPYREDRAQKKILYIRYADDFICGLVSNKITAFEAISYIAFYAAKVGMLLKEEKTNVKHHEDGVYFLGYRIYGDYGHPVQLKSDYSQRVSDAVLKLTIPLNKLFDKFCERGFFMKVKNRKSSKMVARRLDKWLFLDSPYEVILRFNSVIRGVAYYYSGSTYRSVLDRFYSTMKRSAALTLAHMHKKRKAIWAFDKYGHELKVISKTGKVVSLLMPKTGKHAFRDGDLKYALAIPTGVPIPTTLTAVCSVKDLCCAIPNCTLKASQWYHVRYRKRIKGSPLQRKILAYCAKQIPICLNHYQLIHSGKYDGPSIKKLSGYTPSDFNC